MKLILKICPNSQKKMIKKNNKSTIISKIPKNFKKEFINNNKKYIHTNLITI